MGQREMTADLPIVEGDVEDTATEDRLRGAGDIVAGVAGVIFVIVLAWVILSMTGVLGG